MKKFQILDTGAIISGRNMVHALAIIGAKLIQSSPEWALAIDAKGNEFEIAPIK